VEKLTDATARAARPGAVARDLADGTVAGLALRVLPSGAKTWGLRARLGGQRIRVDLGTYPATTLKDARRKAQDTLRIIERGDDPRYEGITVAEAVTEYLNSKIGNCRARTLASERRRFEIHVLPVIGTHGIRTVKPARLSALLRGMTIGADPKPVEANRVYASLRGLFRWCRRNMGCPDDPTALIDKPTKVEPSVVRRREGTQPLLDMSELASLWRSASVLPGSVLPDLVRCLLLVPLRREEWTQLQWREVCDDFAADGWTGAALHIPAARMKGRRPAIVPLSPAVAEILEARRKLTGRGDFVFAVSGRDTPFAGWRGGVDTLRATLGERTGLRSSEDWSVHTIRASVATAMVRDLKAEELLVGRILQHSPSNVLGVTHVYQRSSRLAEQAELLGRWSAHLQAVAAALPTADKRVAALPQTMVVEGRRAAPLSDV
jgi:integrase